MHTLDGSLRAGRWFRAGLTALTLTALGGCSTQALLADALAQTAQQDDEDDLQLAREASAFYLKLSESVLREQPGHARLGAAVASGFAQYAYAFVAFEAEKREATEPQAARAQRQRAARLFERASGHARRALAAPIPDFEARLQTDRPPTLTPDQQALAYWAAASWAARISLSKDQPEVVADWPLAERLARWLWQQQPQWGEGDLAALMGSLEAARPGGQAARAQAYFDQARAWSGARKAGVCVAEAEALASTDRPRWEALLREAVAIAQRHPNLANAVMRERAQWLLDTADDRF